MHQTFGWRNYQFHDTHCGTEGGEQIYYDLENGVFNMCSIEVVKVEKVFYRTIKKRFSEIEVPDTMIRHYMKITYFSPDRPEKASSEIFDIREEEVPAAEALCTELRKKIQAWNDARRAEMEKSPYF